MIGGDGWWASQPTSENGSVDDVQAPTKVSNHTCAYVPSRQNASYFTFYNAV